MFSIVVNEKGGEQQRLEFDKPEVTIGRVQGNDIVLPKGNVSKRHSRIVLKDGKFIIVDLKSTNGTYVNGRKITSPLVVKGTDKIYIGDFILGIEDSAAAGAVEAPPAPPPRKSPTVPPPPPRRTAPMEPPEDDDRTSGTGEPVAEVPAPPPPEPRPRAVTAPPPVAARPAAAPAPAARATLGGVEAPRPAPVRPAPAARAPAPRRPSVAPVAAPAPRSAPDRDGHSRAVECLREITARLRERLDRGVDDPGLVVDDALWSRAEGIAAEVAAEVALDGLPAGLDPGTLAQMAVAEAVGAGAFDALLSDETVREVLVPRYDRVYVDRQGQLTLESRWFSSPEALERAVLRLVARAGATAPGGGAQVEARLPGGLLLSAALPPLAPRGPSVTIRRPRRDAARMGDLVEQGMLSQGMSDFLELALRHRRNVVIAGPAGSGRSTILGAMARTVADTERVVLVEEAEELDLGDGPWAGLTGHGPLARQAVQHALRRRAERLALGDVRGPEALDVVGAMAAGVDGVLCAVQAASTRDALDRLSAMARLAPEAPSMDALGEEVGRGVQVVVYLARASDGEARVVEISDVTSARGTAQLQTVFSFKPDGAGGRFAPTGHVPAWAESASAAIFRG